MWRFILVTFAFMGWAFYELSGGADYAPRDGSRQAAMAERAAADVQRETIARETGRALKQAIQPQGSENDQIVLASANPDTSQVISDRPRRLKLSFSNPDNTGRGVAVALARTEKVARLTEPALPGAEHLNAEEQADLAIAIVRGVHEVERPAEPDTDTPTRVVQDTQEDTNVSGADIREVTGNRVNLRGGPGTDYNVVDKLVRGARVEVLDDIGDGWVKLQVEETGRIGWMADFLLTAAN